MLTPILLLLIILLYYGKGWPIIELLISFHVVFLTLPPCFLKSDVLQRLFKGKKLADVFTFVWRYMKMFENVSSMR